MHADNLVVNDCTTWQAVESITKLLPHFDGESATTLVVEAVDSVDTSTFVVSSKEKEVFRVFNLVSKEEADNFQ
jgi:hypothetical protein